MEQESSALGQLREPANHGMKCSDISFLASAYNDRGSGLCLAPGRPTGRMDGLVGGWFLLGWWVGR